MNERYCEEKIMPEIWDLLDEKGEKIGKTIRKGEPIPEGLYHAGADVWILNADNQILIQKRSPKKRLQPNVWAMTGGSTFKGETSLQTIDREVFEELGIRLNMQNLKFIKCFKTGEVWIDTYFTRQNIDLKDITMQEAEVCEVKWASFDEVEEIFRKGKFIKNRWEFVRDLIKEKIENVRNEQ